MILALALALAITALTLGLIWYVRDTLAVIDCEPCKVVLHVSVSEFVLPPPAVIEVLDRYDHVVQRIPCALKPGSITLHDLPDGGRVRVILCSGKATTGSISAHKLENVL